MNVARLLRPRHLLSRHLPFSSCPPLSRPLTAPPFLPVNGTIDQKLDFLMVKAVELNKALAGINVQLRFLTAGIGTICASEAGLLVWYIQDSIKEKRKSKGA
ncbi:hypothetical protein TWF281_011026 [Arthrobotrys megalospora]